MDTFHPSVIDLKKSESEICGGLFSFQPILKNNVKFNFEAKQHQMSGDHTYCEVFLLCRNEQNANGLNASLFCAGCAVCVCVLFYVIPPAVAQKK